ncbi:MAG TPA: DUF448 domain-containing protein [Acidimicrobiia bacterium]|nr:MAG: YlxR family protein [Actinomycetota bacterium]HIM65529.1 DUF448 domain-containing protein [Acidimicrobiia bacterium]HIM84796.1 DUF448 domain-containing protein [Acidimicrobiia bacterium]
MGPERTCIGCRRRTPQAELARISWSDPDGGGQGGLVVGRGGVGRGAWLHPDVGCAEALRPGALARALRRPLTDGQVAALLTAWPPR